MIDSLVLPGTEKLDVRDKDAVAKRIKGAVSAKQHGLEDVLCPLIAEVGSFDLLWSMHPLSCRALPCRHAAWQCWTAAAESGVQAGMTAGFV